MSKILRDIETVDKFMSALGSSDTHGQQPQTQSISNALRESAFQYVALLLILLSNFYSTGQWDVFLSLALAFGVFLFSGWVKKIAELKINELLAAAGLKDREIQILKEVKAKLEAELQRLTDKLTDLSNGGTSTGADRAG